MLHILTPFTRRDQLWRWQRRGLIMGGVLGLVASVRLLDHMRAGFCARLYFMETLLAVMGWGVFLITPVIIAPAAAWLTARRTRPEYFDLYYLTPLTNRTLIRAHVYEAGRALRHVWALLIVLTLFLPVFSVDVLRRESTSGWYCNYDLRDNWEVFQAIFIVLLVCGLWWGWNALGLAVGVRLGILRRRTHWAVLSALVLIVLAMGCLPLLIWWTADATPQFWDSMTVTRFMFFQVFLMLIPFWVAWGILAQTVQAWARE